MRQNFRSRELGLILGRATSSRATHAKFGSILFARNENIAHVMPRVTAHAVMSCAHRAVRARRQAGRPKNTWRARNYLWTCRSRKPNYIYQK